MKPDGDFNVVTKYALKKVGVRYCPYVTTRQQICITLQGTIVTVCSTGGKLYIFRLDYLEYHITFYYHPCSPVSNRKVKRWAFSFDNTLLHKVVLSRLVLECQFPNSQATLLRIADATSALDLDDRLGSCDLLFSCQFTIPPLEP